MGSDLFDIDPPLINSANPWATDINQLRELYHCPHLGAITVRTSTLSGFAHDDDVHQYVLYDPKSPGSSTDTTRGSASLNTLGYSPIPLGETLETLGSIVAESQVQKPIIVSITGSVDEIRECIRRVEEAQSTLAAQLAVEINLSCPNISGKSPPAFTLEGLTEFFDCVRTISSTLQIGVKTPPYSNPDDFAKLKKALLLTTSQDRASRHPLRFITATNTLGCSLLLDDQTLSPQLKSVDGSGVGGLAGAPLHPLSLGNVKMIRALLDAEPVLKDIKVIGIGGVGDAAGFERMRAVGADIVGVGTALGSEGVSVFKKIIDHVGD